MAAIEPQRSQEQDTTSGCLVRLAWILVGNIVLAGCILSIANNTTFFSWADIVFWATLAAVIGLRYIDIARLNGRTTTGEPATMAHWRRYCLLMIAAAFVVWIAAHVWAWRAAQA